MCHDKIERLRLDWQHLRCVEWEVYHLNFDLEEQGRSTADASVCCATDAACST